MTNRKKASHLALVAHHEAGHAVVAHKLGAKVRRVLIATDGGGWAKITGHGAGERAILIALAGPYAQRRYAPRSRWRSLHHWGFMPRGESAPDFDVVHDLILRMEHESEKVARAYLRYAEARAEQLVEQHWRQIEHVARELIQHRTLTGEAMRTSWYEKEILPQISAVV